MRELAKHVSLLSGFPPNGINVYLVGDLLVDAGTRWAEKRIARELEGRKLSGVVLTHVHPDHQGVARSICERYQIPLACNEADVPTMQGERPMQPDNPFIRLTSRLWAGPPYRISRVLREGDDVAGFRVVHSPGHTPGHIILLRDDDGVAIVGDVLNGMNLLTAWPGLHEPPRIFTADVAENRRSIRRLLELEPRLICFGHGPPLADMTKLEKFVERLPT